MSQAWFGPGRNQRLAAYLLLSSGCIAFALIAGKDLNWDLINYHYYLGYSVFHDRLAQDFFPASVLSYAVPFAYAPLYLLISSGLDDRLICVVLAVMGSTALWAVWEVGGLLGSATSRARRFSVPQAYLGAVLAAICPVYFIQVGTSYIDITTAAIAVFGYVFLIRFVMRQSRAELVLAAVLLGISVALKQTNVLYAIAGVSLIWAAGSPRALNLGIYSVAGVLGGGAVMVPWGIKLYREFGNPLFPNLNSIFKSADFDTSPLSPHYRFIPDTLLDALLRPIWMMSPESGVYTEPPAPDARFFFLAVFVLIACVVMILRRRTRNGDGAEREIRGESAALKGTIAAFVLSWCVWLTLSGNGRYFMPMALLAGPLIVASVHFVGVGRRWLMYSLGSVFAVSASLAFMASALRYSPSPWSGQYFEVEVPPALVDRPHVFLSLDIQPAAFVVPFLHPRSSFVNVAGMHVLGPGRPGWNRVERLMSGDAAPRFLLPVLLDARGEMLPLQSDYLASLTGRMGYRIDSTTCEKIVLRGLASSSPGVSSSADGRPQVSVTHSSDSVYAVCEGRFDANLRAQYLSQSAAIDALFDAVERRCPAIFPRGAVTEGLGNNWRRTYAATDTVLYYYNNKVRYHRFGQTKHRVVGSSSELLEGTFSVECHRKRDPLLTIDDLLT